MSITSMDETIDHRGTGRLLRPLDDDGVRAEIERASSEPILRLQELGLTPVTPAIINACLKQHGMRRMPETSLTHFGKGPGIGARAEQPVPSHTTYYQQSTPSPENAPYVLTIAIEEYKIIRMRHKTAADATGNPITEEFEPYRDIGFTISIGFNQPGSIVHLEKDGPMVHKDELGLRIMEIMDTYLPMRASATHE